MLSRIRSGGDVTTEQQDQETRRAIHGVRNNFPDAFRTMRPNANDVRRFLKNTGREKPKNMPLSGVPILKLGQQEFLLAVKRFTTKLFCALHYKHVGAIVPATGVIASHFFSNVQVFDGKIPSDILTVELDDRQIHIHGLFVRKKAHSRGSYQQQWADRDIVVNIGLLTLMAVWFALHPNEKIGTIAETSHEWTTSVRR
jgi:hypothetical protein